MRRPEQTFALPTLAQPPDHFMNGDRFVAAAVSVTSVPCSYANLHSIAEQSGGEELGGSTFTAASNDPTLTVRYTSELDDAPAPAARTRPTTAVATNERSMTARRGAVAVSS